MISTRMRKRDVREGAGNCEEGIRRPLWPLSLQWQWDADAQVTNHLEETGNLPLLPFHPPTTSGPFPGLPAPMQESGRQNAQF